MVTIAADMFVNKCAVNHSEGKKDSIFSPLFLRNHMSHAIAEPASTAQNASEWEWLLQSVAVYWAMGGVGGLLYFSCGKNELKAF